MTHGRGSGEGAFWRVWGALGGAARRALESLGGPQASGGGGGEDVRTHIRT